MKKLIFKEGDKIRMKKDCWAGENTFPRKGDFCIVHLGDMDGLFKSQLHAWGDAVNSCSCTDKWELVKETRGRPKGSKNKVKGDWVDNLKPGDILVNEYGEFLEVRGPAIKTSYSCLDISTARSHPNNRTWTYEYVRRYFKPYTEKKIKVKAGYYTKSELEELIK